MAAISFILVSCSTYPIVIKYLQIKDESNRYDYADLNILGDKERCITRCDH